MVYYSEIDPGKAVWLRELVAAGLVAKGDVDVRSIRDVQPGDLSGYTQCHFFAGIGVWSYALRLAGWPDDRPVWTGSCPCQPFSVAGRRGGTTDDRHLWPEWYRLIRACRPVQIFGEQVSSPDGLAWFDAVSTDLEGSGYTTGALDLCAAGVGAPHIRQRLYFGGTTPGNIHGKGPFSGAQSGVYTVDGAILANPADQRHNGRGTSEAGGWTLESDRLRASGIVGDTEGERRQRRPDNRDEGRRECALRSVGQTGILAQSTGAGLEIRRSEPNDPGEQFQALERTGATRGHWAGAHWVLTRPKRVGDPPGIRPVGPWSFPLADGAPARVGRLRGYGDAIVAPLAAEFIRAWEGMI